MRARGIAYSTGFVIDGINSVEPFDPDLVRRELAVIRDDLHCNAVHIVGGDPERLEFAARTAAGLGLEIWFSPYPLELEPEQVLTLFLDCADRAERLRAQGAEVVLVTGAELTLMVRGFVDGAHLDDRLDGLFSEPDRRAERIGAARARLDRFLRTAVPAIRERFHGRLTYSAIPFEGVDWTLFDIVTLELIRSAEVAGQFREAVRGLVAQPETPQPGAAQTETAQTETAQTERAQTGAAQTGAAQTGAAQTGAAQTGAAQTGAAQTGAAQTGAAQTGAAQTGAARPGVARPGTARPKPVAITGFGAATWRGAGDVAPRSMEVLELDPVTRAPVRLKATYERDEDSQAAYLGELLDIFDSEGVDSAFVYLFALADLPHRPDGDPRDDLDLASPGIVKVLDGHSGHTDPGLPWEPKAAFGAIAEHYRRQAARQA